MANPSKKVEKEFLLAFDKYSDAIFRFFFFRVHDSELATELVQDTYIKVWNYIVEGKEISRFKPFLYKVARNLVIDYVRKKKDLSLERMTEQGFCPNVDDVDERHLKMDIEELLEKLSLINQKYAEILKLRYIDGLRPKDIAQVLGESENVVSVRIHRGKKELKKIVGYEKNF